MKFILGKKLDMTQVWQGDKVIAVTKVQAGPCIVTQIKNKDRDGYEAIQVGYGKRREKNIKKPQKGHLKKTKAMPRFLKEFRFEAGGLSVGDSIDVSTFEAGDKIQAIGISKGKGFQGVVKRYGFHGQSKTHGTKDQVRMPGSAGATGPAHVFKGQKMPGRMGDDRVTVKNLKIIEVDQKNNILLIKGAVPGARNGLLLISGEGELKTAGEREETKKESEKKEQKDKEASGKKELEQKKDEVVEKEENIEKVVEEADEKRRENSVNNKEDEKIKHEAGEEKLSDSETKNEKE